MPFGLLNHRFFLFYHRPVLAVVFHWDAFEFVEAWGCYEFKALFFENWNGAVYGFEGGFVSFEYVQKIHYAVGLVFEHEFKALIGGAFRDPVFAAVATDKRNMNDFMH